MLIDSTYEEQFFELNLDITFPKAPCSILSLDVVDVTGVHDVNIEGRLHKHALDENGKRKGVTDAIKQAQGNRNEDVVTMTAKQQLKDKEGCQMEGEVKLHKVPGNFHISSHDIPNVVVNLVREAYKIDFSHTVNHLSFGKKSDQVIIKKRYGGHIDNELNGGDKTQVIPFG